MIKITKDGRHTLLGDQTTEPSELHSSVEEVLASLQIALKLELSTIPPYLTTLYSIQPGTNQIPAEIIRSVVVEEMLHMVLVANLMNALGGKPVVNTKEVVPQYPGGLPGNIMPNLNVELAHFSIRTIRLFEQIEHPEGDLQFQNEATDSQASVSIGSFYAKIKASLRELELSANKEGKTIFTGKNPQVGSEHYYGSGGKLATIHNLDSANSAIDEIVGQGEGVLDSIWADKNGKPEDYKIFGTEVSEIAHYFRFKEVRCGRFYHATDSAHRDSPNQGLPSGEHMDLDWHATSKIKPAPKMDDYKHDEALYQKALDFNLSYMALLDNLQKAFDGQPEVLKTGIPIMYALRYKAEALLNIPIGDGYMAAPTFEYVER